MGESMAKFQPFYTYLWLRNDGTPYYVGKGRGDRAFSGPHTVHRPIERERILIQEWPSEAEAFEAEIFLIAFYGRKDIGTGILRNLTDGGEGSSGLKDSVRLRRNAKMVGNHYGLGYRHTEEAKRLIGEASKRANHRYPRPARRGVPVPQEIRDKMRNTQRHTHCQRGHAFTDANTYVRPDNGKRQCIACRTLRQERRQSCQN